jgi:SAM-dependent methyltransferase
VSSNDEQLPGAMEAEFDTVAAWTEQVVADLGPDYAIPAACRGSGSPSWLRWIADRLAMQPGERFLDAGAGLGGPAAWLKEHSGVTPVLAEPMERACVGARRLFGFPTVAAWSQHLPFASESFDACWLLGVLSTTSDHAGLLAELGRVIAPGGRLGLLVLVQVQARLPVSPEGNHFPTPETLDDDLRGAGFDVLDHIVTAELQPPGEQWQRRTAEVEEALQRRFSHRAAWQTAQRQEEQMSRLLEGGAVATWLVSARRRPDGWPPPADRTG